VVKGDQNDIAQTPVAKQAPKMTPPTTPPRTTASTSIANGPMSLAPQSTPAAAASGGYVVQLSSQRSESDAQASYRALQGKFPTVLGSRSPLIKRADLGEKGTFYRAAVGPFSTPEEAAQICGSLKTAGGQCVVQRN
jgi:cell division septation protein DedD